MDFIEKGKCEYFNLNSCLSCSRLKEASRLPKLPEELFTISEKVLPWIQSPSAFGLRAKARFSVTGISSNPVVGILDKDLNGISLLKCPLHRDIINQSAGIISGLIAKYEISPYQIRERSGDLKNIIIQTNSKEDSIRVRFVCANDKIRKDLNELSKDFIDCLSKIRESGLDFFSSLNVQPIPHQIPEGEQEICLYNEGFLREEYSGLSLFFPARSFMQVTPEVASFLYQSVAKIVDVYNDRNVLDLYSGVGGFALACAGSSKKVIGVEISEDAVGAAKFAARYNKIGNVTFYKKDLLQESSIISDVRPDVLICNPPRRGLGDKVLLDIKKGLPEIFIYSSCNYVSFLSDYQYLEEAYYIETIQPFEMFPLTNHFELLAVLIRK